VILSSDNTWTLCAPQSERVAKTTFATFGKKEYFYTFLYFKIFNEINHKINPMYLNHIDGL